MIIAIETPYTLTYVAVFSGEQNDISPEQALLNDFLFYDSDSMKKLLLEALYNITDQLGIEQDDFFDYHIESMTNSNTVDYIIFLHPSDYVIKKL